MFGLAKGRINSVKKEERKKRSQKNTFSICLQERK